MSTTQNQISNSPGIKKLSGKSIQPDTFYPFFPKAGISFFTKVLL